MTRELSIPDKEVTQASITRVLVIGFTLVILFLTIGGTVAYTSVASIPGNVTALLRQEYVNRRLIEALQDEQKNLGTVFYSLTGDPAAAKSNEISASLALAQSNLKRIQAEAQPTATEKPLWDELLRASAAFAEEARIPKAEPRELFRRNGAVVSAISQLESAGFAKIVGAEDEIGRSVGQFTGQSAALLFASFGLALVCSIFTVRATRQLFRRMAWQENELTRVSWQMLSDQESIARRFSHELHDELGQTLAALRANLTSTVAGSRAEDSISLTDDAIRSVRHLSQLLRPTVLDDFGLDASLNWLCEGFMERTGIEVEYRSEHQSRLADKTETQLFRIAQEALTNVARHSGATRVLVRLSSANRQIRLRISDNGHGIRETEATEGGFGMTGMRARARAAGGVFLVDSSETGGLAIEVRVPMTEEKKEGNEDHESHPHPAG